MTDEPKPDMTTRQQLDEAFDRNLLDVIQNGTDVINKDGEVVHVKATHQFFEVARKRLSDLGYTKEEDPEGSIARMAKELGLTKANVHDLPPVSEEEDNLGKSEKVS